MHLSGHFLLLLLLTATTLTTSHNITSLLSHHPSFTTFNHYLSETHLSDEINRRTTITVCALDNTAMSNILAKKPSIYTVKNILSLHILLDYYGTKKLHQITNGTALTATMFQATGSAPGSAGFVNITDLKGGKVGFGPDNNEGKLGVFYVKSLEEVPYNISVIHISDVLPSDVAAAPTPEPSKTNLTDTMSAHGCKFFADTLNANPDAASTFQGTIDGGLTVFCPLDDAFKAFLPKYKNLTAAGKVSFLEFFGVPIYQSLSMLKSSNGLTNTLATDGARNFDFTVQNDGNDVTLKENGVTAKIVGTLLDEQPLAIYTIDKVLLPTELFKPEPTPAPAPAPEKPAADAPKSSKHGKSSSADSPANAPSDADPADQTADDNAGMRLNGKRLVFAVLSLCIGISML